MDKQKFVEKVVTSTEEHQKQHQLRITQMFERQEKLRSFHKQPPIEVQEGKK